MARKIFPFIPALLFFSIIMLFSECERNKVNPVGSDLFNKSMGLVMPPLTIAVHDTVYTSNTPTGQSQYLYAGVINKRKAYSLFRFTGLPDSVTVDTAIFTINVKKFIGNYPGGLLPDAYILNYKFDEETFTWQDFSDLNPVDAKINIEPYPSNSDSVISFTIPPEIVQTWADTNSAEQNYGFAITYDVPDTGFIAKIYSQNYNSYDYVSPHMVLKTHMGDSFYTYNVTPFDVFVIEPEQDNNDDTHFIIDNSSGTRSILFFNVDSVPEDATINSAVLTFYVDTTYTFPSVSDTFMLRILNVTDDSWPIPDVPYDSSSSITKYAYSANDSLTANITSIVQSWTSGSSVNGGVLLMGYWEGIDISRKKFFNDKAEPLKRPFVKIFYTIPPKR